MSKPAHDFLNHTFTSFSSAGQKVLQTCPSLTKLLPSCSLVANGSVDGEDKKREKTREIAADSKMYWYVG